MKADGDRPEARVFQDGARFREALQIGSVQRVDLCLGLFERGSGLQPGDVAPVVVDALLQLLRQEGQRYPGLNVGLNQLEVGRHDTDDRMGFAVEANHFADHVAAVEDTTPQAVAQNHLGVLTNFTGCVVEDASTLWRHTRHAKEGGRHWHDLNALRRGSCVKGRLRLAEHRLFLKCRHISQALDIVRSGSGGALSTSVGITVVHVHQLVRVRYGKRPEEDVVHDREQCGVGTNTHGQCDQRGEREAPVGPEHSPRDAKI